MDNAFKYIKDNGGIDTEDSYPYEAAEDRQCRYNPNNNGATDVGFVDVNSGDENALKSAIATQVGSEGFQTVSNTDCFCSGSLQCCH